MKPTNQSAGRVEIQVKGNHLVVTPALRDAVVQKMSNLDRYFNRLQSIEVELCFEKTRESSHHNRVEATTRIAGRTVRVTAVHEDMYAAIDESVDKLHRSLNRLKERSKSHGTSKISETLASADDSDSFLPSSDEPRSDSGDPVVIHERLEVQPQFEEEAIATMNESGLAFYVFLNAHTESVNVLYRHGDGSYGLIQPKTR